MISVLKTAKVDDDAPLHYNKKALPVLVEIFIDVNNSDDVGTGGSPPVHFHLSSSFGTIMKHLQERMKRRPFKTKFVKNIYY